MPSRSILCRQRLYGGTYLGASDDLKRENYIIGIQFRVGLNSLLSCYFHSFTQMENYFTRLSMIPTFSEARDDFNGAVVGVVMRDRKSRSLNVGVTDRLV